MVLDTTALQPGSNGFSNFGSADHQIFFSPRPRPAVRGPSTPPAPRHWAGRHQLDQQHPARSGAQQQQGRLAVGRGVASGGATEGGRPAARISEAISTSLLQINQQPWRSSCVMGHEIHLRSCGLGACDLLIVGLETFETVPRAMIRSSGDNKEKQSMCTREELEREEGMTRIFRTLPSHVGVHTNPWDEAWL
ncbi:uncharacterized protein [Miscanthus floridulus]|uniref:uncharacterized protein isoform X3 n=1 Tax=Miscanthus floridulus TaxID=154761 RepID=UPI003459ED36